MSNPPLLPKLVLVSGFLGAGKTTLILRAASILTGRGLRVAVITNDQDGGLVDTQMSRSAGLPTGEVAGGCFCCRFSDLLDAAEQLRSFAPDVIFAEPVGSCVDLSATILQPLKAFHAGEYRVAPLTLLMDPESARAVVAGEADPDVRYLFEKQIQEADIVCTTKSDLYDSVPPLPCDIEFRTSAVTGEGVSEWLNEALESKRVVGARLLDVDYTRYAEAEAALSWLNMHVNIDVSEPVTPAGLIGPLLENIDGGLTQGGIAIAHLKVFDRADGAYVKAGVCRNGSEPAVEGDLCASPAVRHETVINLRAIGDPEELRRIVREALDQTGGEITVRHDGAFRPAPPKPEHRFKALAR